MEMSKVDHCNDVWGRHRLDALRRDILRERPIDFIASE